MDPDPPGGSMFCIPGGRKERQGAGLGSLFNGAAPRKGGDGDGGKKNSRKAAAGRGSRPL